MNQKERRQYVGANRHKIKHPQQWVGYVPKRIDSPNPILRCLSLNILFGRYTVRNGKPAFACALYEPDYASVKTAVQNDTGCISMDYYNRHDHRAKITLKYYVTENRPGRYEAVKYFEDKLIGIAEGGNDWDRFFIQVSFLEFVVGEIVEFS